MTQQSALPTAQDTKRRLAVPDYINIGVFSALYFMIVALCALVSNIIFGVAGNLLLPAFAALLAGPVFMLLNARVRAFGATTTMGMVLGLFLFVSGHFATSLVTGIVFPLLGNTTATSVILNAVWIWNDYLLPFLVIGNRAGTKTLTLSLYFARLTAGQYANPWELIFPAVLITILPVVVLFLFLQKRIVRGVAAGAVKG